MREGAPPERLESPRRNPSYDTGEFEEPCATPRGVREVVHRGELSLGGERGMLDAAPSFLSITQKHEMDGDTPRPGPGGARAGLSLLRGKHDGY